jgi:CBS domain-containing protein
MSLKIQEIMTKEVVTLDGKTTVIEAVAIMDKREISCLVIVQEESPIGIVTERDVLRRVLLEGKDPATTKVFQIMSAPLVIGDPQMSIQDAIKLMTEKNIKKLPLMENGRLVGMITLTDLARSIAYLEHIFSKTQDGPVV